MSSAIEHPELDHQSRAIVRVREFVTKHWLACSAIYAFTLITGGVMLQVSRAHFDTGAFGSWLAGTLTPGLILVALVSLSQDHTAAGRITFLDHHVRLQGHLRYMARCVCAGHEVADIRKEGERDPFDALLYVADDNVNAIQKIPWNGQSVFRLDDGAVPLARAFIKDAKFIISMADRVDMAFLLDRRIPAIVRSLERHPRIVADVPTTKPVW